MRLAFLSSPAVLLILLNYNIKWFYSLGYWCTTPD